MAKYKEELCIQKTLKGDMQAFAQIVNQYQDFVYTVILRMVKNNEDAEELAQDVFIKVFHSIRDYKGESKFSTWLYTIAYRKALDKLKVKKRTIDINSLSEYSSTEEILNFNTTKNALDILQENERTELITTSILQLKPELASIFTFYYFEEQSIKEIAKITNLSQDNVKVKLYRGRAKLYAILQNQLISEKSH